MSEIIYMLQASLEKELTSDVLASLDESIYVAVSERMKHLITLERDADPNTAKLVRKEITLLSTLVRELLATRLKKFFSNILKGLNDTRLLPQEKYIVEPLYEAIRRIKELENTVLYGHSSHVKRFYNLRKQKYLLVKFKKSINKFVGVDLKTYGPFECEDVAVIPMENAKILIDKGVVVDMGVL